MYKPQHGKWRDNWKKLSPSWKNNYRLLQISLRQQQWDVHPWCTLRYLFGKNWETSGVTNHQDRNNDGATSNSNTNNEQPWTITPSIFQVTFDYPTFEKKHFSNLRKGRNGKNQNSIQSNSDFLSQREIDQTPGGSKLSTLGVQHFLGGRSKILCFTSPCWVFHSFETCLEPIFFRKTHIFAEPTSFWFLAVRFRECKFHPYHLFMCAIEMVPASAHIEKSPFKLWLIPTHMNSKNTPWHPKFQPKTNGMKVLHTRWGTPWTKQDFHLKKEEPNKKQPPSTKNRVFWLQKKDLFSKALGLVRVTCQATLAAPEIQVKVWLGGMDCNYHRLKWTPIILLKWGY